MPKKPTSNLHINKWRWRDDIFDETGIKSICICQSPSCAAHVKRHISLWDNSLRCKCHKTNHRAIFFL